MLTRLQEIRFDCAKTILTLHKKANSGHIGASLSCLEILVYLCFHKMEPEDVLILSKGHAASALYTVLAKSGRIDASELASYYNEATRFAAHPPCARQIPAIPFGTGSLGHGLSLATGIAFSQKFTGKKFKVYVILSDGDCNEGSTWEAALFAAHHKLSNLSVIVDANGLQGFGRSDDVLNLEPLSEKWSAFGFRTMIAPCGNNFDAINEAFENLVRDDSLNPSCVIAKTIKGHGVSYMENKMEWHYLPMTDEQYTIAVSEQDYQDA